MTNNSTRTAAENRWRAPRRERGAVLVHVAIALVGLLGISALVLDYGVLWLARGRAQNSADAAALAGATSFAFDKPGDWTAAVAAGTAAAASNVVWNDGKTQQVEILQQCPAGMELQTGETCVRANVYRNAGDSRIRTFLAPVFGYSYQGVRATATAKVAQGSYVNCVKPWAVGDKWLDLKDDTAPKDAVWGWDDEYDRYDWNNKDKRFDLITAPRDAYWKPNEPPQDGHNVPHPGFTPATIDRGIVVNLKVGSPRSNKPVEASWFYRLDLDGGGTSNYEKWITQCFPGPRTVDDGIQGNADDPYTYVQSLPGNANQPTAKAVQDLINLDPTAYWDTTKNEVVSTYAGVSPRIVPIPVISIEDYYENFLKKTDKADPLYDGQGNWNGVQGRFLLPIVKILAFFVENYQTGDSQDDLRGRFIGYYPARVGGGGSGPTSTSPELRSVHLVR